MTHPDDLDVIADALDEAMIYAPSENDNQVPCMIRDAQQALARVRERVIPELPEGWQITELRASLDKRRNCIVTIESKEQLIIECDVTPHAAITAALASITKGNGA